MIKTIQAIWLHILVTTTIFLVTGCVTLGQETERTREAERFSVERIEQLVAPIALYPDALLAQVFMAATYPFEVIQAARWVRKYPHLTGEELQNALQSERWDPSVKSLTAFPGVLERMEEDLDWMDDLGKAFLSQQGEVMDAVQRLRARARDAGHLESTPQQNVVIKDRIIVVNPTQPEVVYVPSYNPALVFGGWDYPTLYYSNLYRPPSNPAVVAGLFTFGVGAGLLLSQFDWERRHVIVEHRDYNYQFKPMTPPTYIPWQHNFGHRRYAHHQRPVLDPGWGREPPSSHREWSNPTAGPSEFNSSSFPDGKSLHYPTPQAGQGMGNPIFRPIPVPEDASHQGKRESLVPSTTSPGIYPPQRSHRPTVPTAERTMNSSPITRRLDTVPHATNIPQGNNSASSTTISREPSGIRPPQRSHRPTVPTEEPPVKSEPSTQSHDPFPASHPRNTVTSPQGNNPLPSSSPPFQRSHRPTVPSIDRPTGLAPGGRSSERDFDRKITVPARNFGSRWESSKNSSPSVERPVFQRPPRPVGKSPSATSTQSSVETKPSQKERPSTPQRPARFLGLGRDKKIASE